MASKEEKKKISGAESLRLHPPTAENLLEKLFYM